MTGTGLVNRSQQAARRVSRMLRSGNDLISSQRDSLQLFRRLLQLVHLASLAVLAERRRGSGRNSWRSVAASMLAAMRRYRSEDPQILQVVGRGAQRRLWRLAPSSEGCRSFAASS